jgi:hypothetical protein
MGNILRTFVDGIYVETHGSKEPGPAGEQPGRPQPDGEAVACGDRQSFMSRWAAGRELARRCEIDGLTKKCFRI